MKTFHKKQQEKVLDV